ncbi:glycosyltransferase family 1 protein (plasmid) [Methylobacterium currus]|uniref:Glycosyltransferase family 1 protein n=1 Tax=Methylobacterium currus TaxID=2051553 RepID=A0A2R4WWX9_9HYPH|nr:glycosyltransferase family 1 protein [Methylobacterium currus]
MHHRLRAHDVPKRNNPDRRLQAEALRSAKGTEQPSLLILGCRGIPAAHGGFETFAERLALFLVARGWRVGVYCQREVATVGRRISVETWRGIDLIQVEVASGGPKATLDFDAWSVVDAARRGGVCLVLGYNGAVFLPYLRLRGRKVVTNMDGIEWRRPKWSWPVRAWFWVNEWIAAWTSHRLIADHPRIADHLATRRPRRAIATIAYGGDPVSSADPAPLEALGLTPDRYLVSIARIEPDNNILTLVEAFSRRRRERHLVVLGHFIPGNRYHAAVRAAASDEVIFPGAIYEPATVQSLRCHARAYLHGHTVGGTNPSLVEALWSGNAVVAHDNPFNRHTAGEDQIYFSDGPSCERAIEAVLSDDALVARARCAAHIRAAQEFSWDSILHAYERECLALTGRKASSGLVQQAAGL